jgi:hypothetical protein
MSAGTKGESGMRPRDLFGVAVRVIGFWFFTQAAYWAYWAALKSHDVSLGNPNVSMREDIATATLYVLMGLIAVVAADPIVWLCYGLPPRKNPDDNAAERAE